MVKSHGQPPRSITVLALRIVLVLLVLLAIVWAAQWRQRISGPTLEHDVAGKLHTTPARCSDQTGNGSRWACLVPCAEWNRVTPYRHYGSVTCSSNSLRER